MREFKQCVDMLALFDFHFYGNTFTWSNKHTSGNVAKKLDKIPVNVSWLLTFPNSIGVFGEPGISDHNHCCVFLDEEKPKQKRPVKFFTMLNHHQEFGELIKTCWQSLSFLGSRCSVYPRTKRDQEYYQNT